MYSFLFHRSFHGRKILGNGQFIEALSPDNSRNNRRHSMKSKCRLYSSYLNQIFHNTFKYETMWMSENDKRIQNSQNNTFVSRNNKTSEDDWTFICLTRKTLLLFSRLSLFGILKCWLKMKLILLLIIIIKNKSQDDTHKAIL